MLTLADAVDDLYRIAVTDARRQATTRMEIFADLCVQELAERGIPEAGKEVTVPGFGRSKKWDVEWSHGGKIRLGINLKSMLRNIAGSVPNRIDYLMGENGKCATLLTGDSHRVYDGFRCQCKKAGW